MANKRRHKRSSGGKTRRKKQRSDGFKAVPIAQVNVKPKNGAKQRRPVGNRSPLPTVGALVRTGYKASAVVVEGAMKMAADKRLRVTARGLAHSDFMVCILSPPSKSWCSSTALARPSHAT